MLLVGTAHCQEQAQPPNDTDLKASYCMGVVQGQLSILQSAFPALSNGGAEVPQGAQTAWREESDRLTHLQSYLIPRLSYRDPTGLLVARTRAQQDMAQLQTPEALACSQTCASALLSGTVDDGKRCLRTCNPEKLPRIWACNDLSWLPF
ncbi:hypothetical protein AB3X82_24780 [Paraburkholderia phenoliruptrix]|uniref:Lysozyme inhibitor LprI N-terminal domain-containing protein n=1 Tax=Paraburkholderia phenoliruptrix TaxID=252970 RepID=A0ABV3WJ99_9BURK